MLRKVIPEFLDELPQDDPRAVHSRRDLRRVNRLMGNAAIMARALTANRESASHSASSKKTSDLVSIVELGGGDGTFLLEVAKRAAPVIGPAHAILVDQQSLVTPATRDALGALSWEVNPVKVDVFDWLKRQGADLADLMMANLFLHHFEDERLTTLLRGASRQTRVFAACEPRRSGAALAASSTMFLIGCNRVTLHDARVSVRAGFRDGELSGIWSGGDAWALEEWQSGRFTHSFVARREYKRA